METFFENGTLTEDELMLGIAKGLISRGMFPVFCISAKKDIGVTRLMDFIVKSVGCIFTLILNSLLNL